MKPIALTLVLACLCACARPADEASDSAASSDTAAGEPAMPRDASTPSNETPATEPPRGIAVGEPHPSSDAVIDAGPARFDGYGDLRLGMSEAEARAAWKGTLQGDEVKADNCAYLRPAGTAAGPYLMFEQGRFVRYDVHGANTVAPGGGRVGMSTADIRGLYAGRVGEKPHHYVEGGQYLRVADTASNANALVFETDAQGRVTTWRVGRAPQVDYVEGCS